MAIAPMAVTVCATKRLRRKTLRKLICINSGQGPTVMYFTHRKGWVATNEQLQDSSFVADLKEHGCKYVLVMKKVFGSEVQLPLDMIMDNEDYAIYRL